MSAQRQEEEHNDAAQTTRRDAERLHEEWLGRDAEGTARSEPRTALDSLRQTRPELHDQIERIDDAASKFCVEMVEAAFMIGFEVGQEPWRLVS